MKIAIVTGASSGLGMAFVRRLDALGKSVIIRYPMIPGYNLDEAEAIADYLTQFSCIERVDLIGYHRFGATKYDQIGMTYTVAGESMPTEQRQEMLELFLSRGHNAQLGG